MKRSDNSFEGSIAVTTRAGKRSGGKNPSKAKTVKRTPLRRSSEPGNPLLVKWSTPFALPPFESIEAKHFAPAFAAALKARKAEITKIAAQTSRPTFANTIVALERAGRTLNRVAGVFYNLTGAHTSEELQAVEREVAPQLAAHETAVMLNPKIFTRVEDLYKRRDRLRLTDEQRRVLELHHAPGLLVLEDVLGKLRGKRREALVDLGDARFRLAAELGACAHEPGMVQLQDAPLLVGEA